MASVRQYLVYALTCLPTGQRYVGRTCVSIPRRWSQHRRNARLGLDFPLYVAMRRHGDAAFDIEHIASATDDDNCNALEKAIIAKEGTQVPRGLNAHCGGQGRARGATAKQRMSEAQKAVWATASRRRKGQLAAAAWRLDGEKVERWRASIAKRATPSYRAKLSTANKAYAATAEGYAKRLAAIAVARVAAATPSARVAHAAAQKKRFSSLTARAAMSQKLKEWRRAATIEDLLGAA
jgi:hypothetical protein